MAVKPILFSESMVRALLDGRKTQTRRVLKPCPWPDEIEPPYVATYEQGARAVWCDPDSSGVYAFSGCAGAAMGDLLWVRETWKPHSIFADRPPRDVPARTRVFYRADETYAPSNTPWVPPIHMPRWASRLTLEVTGVKVERVQDLREADCIAEGAEVVSWVGGLGSLNGPMVATDRDHVTQTPRCWFRELWDSINAKRGFGWEVNPWVVAVTFKVHRCNVDAMKGDTDA